MLFKRLLSTLVAMSMVFTIGIVSQVDAKEVSTTLINGVTDAGRDVKYFGAYSLTLGIAGKSSFVSDGSQIVVTGGADYDVTVAKDGCGSNYIRAYINGDISNQTLDGSVYYEWTVNFSAAPAFIGMYNKDSAGAWGVYPGQLNYRVSPNENHLWNIGIPSSVPINQDCKIGFLYNISTGKWAVYVDGVATNRTGTVKDVNLGIGQCWLEVAMMGANDTMTIKNMSASNVRTVEKDSNELFSGLPKTGTDKEEGGVTLQSSAAGKSKITNNDGVFVMSGDCSNTTSNFTRIYLNTTIKKSGYLWYQYTVNMSEVPSLIAINARGSDNGPWQYTENLNYSKSNKENHLLRTSGAAIVPGQDYTFGFLVNLDDKSYTITQDGQPTKLTGKLRDSSVDVGMVWFETQMNSATGTLTMKDASVKFFEENNEPTEALYEGIPMFGLSKESNGISLATRATTNASVINTLGALKATAKHVAGNSNFVRIALDGIVNDTRNTGSYLVEYTVKATSAPRDLGFFSRANGSYPIAIHLVNADSEVDFAKMRTTGEVYVPNKEYKFGFLYNAETGEYRVFQDDKPTALEGTVPIMDGDVRVMSDFFMELQTQTEDDYVVISALKVTEVTFKSNSCVIIGNTINGFNGMSVADVINDATVSKGINAVILNADGTNANAAEMVKRGMILRLATPNGTVIEEYTFDKEFYAVTNARFLVNGDEKLQRYVEGTVSAKYDLQNFTTTPLNVNAIIAQYTNDGKMLSCAMNRQVVQTGSATIMADIDIESSAMTYVKSYLFDDNQAPLYDVITMRGTANGLVDVSFTYPGFAYKAITFSYDDLNPNDETLANIFRKYGIGATFNLMTSRFSNENPPYPISKISSWYDGFDAISHSYTHPPMYLTEPDYLYGVLTQPLTYDEVIYEIDRSLEDMKTFMGKDTIGFVWPYREPADRSDFDDIMNHIKNNTTIKYCRPTTTTGNFSYPDDWYYWHPTIHHDQLPNYFDLFLNADPNGELLLFSIWGHAEEFNPTIHPTANKVHFDDLEEYCKVLSEHDDIWKADNTEIYIYKNAVDNAIIDYENGTITNPAEVDIYAFVNGMKVVIPAGETYIYKPNNVIACWGDSLTFGQGSTDWTTKSYPATLARLSGLEVMNMGIGGESSMTIAARAGGVEVRLDEDITIPSDKTPVSIKINGYDFDGTYAGDIVPRDVNLGGWTPCTLAGVSGKLSVEIADTWPRTLTSATFTRLEDGEAVLAPKGSRIYPDSLHAMERADINVIFTGTNGGWNNQNKLVDENDADDLVTVTDKIIAQANDPSKCIVIGLIRGDSTSTVQTDAALSKAYGERFLNVKKYLASEQALIDAKIAPTAEDRVAIAKGSIPPSLLYTDGGHLNDYGYALMGKLVYEKLLDLGWID